MAIPVAAAGGAGDGPDDPVREIRRLIFRLGKMKFGLPMPEIELAIQRMEDLTQLEKLCDRILEATNWAEVLAPDE